MYERVVPANAAAKRNSEEEGAAAAEQWNMYWSNERLKKAAIYPLRFVPFQL